MFAPAFEGPGHRFRCYVLRTVPRRRAQIPNYITVREEALGIPPSMPPVIIRWLWESADRLALADWHDGGLLVAGAD